jgi:fatty-acyl-CoA synthase
MSDNLSIVHGALLSEEPGLGALTLPGFFRDVTTRYADREAIVFHTSDGVMRWSYAELWRQSVEIARALIACGVGKDSRVGVLMSNRPEWIASIFGIGLASGVAVALSTFSTPPELEYLLRVSGVSTLLFERRVGKKDFAGIIGDLEPQLAAAQPGRLVSSKFPFLRRLAVLGEGPADGAIESWSAFLQHGQSVPAALVDATSKEVLPSDTGLLLFSSGSTAQPKGVFSSHRAVAIQCWRMRRLFALGDDVRTWAANAFFWSGNFTTAMGATMAAGGALVLQSVFDPEEALRLMQEERVTYPVAWPHQWAQLEDAPNWKTVDLSSLVYADRAHPIGRHPTASVNWVEPRAFGNTEGFTFFTAFSSDTPPEKSAGSAGEVLAGCTVKIVDPQTGAVVPRGERGEIVVKGPTLMLGYLGTPLIDTLDNDGFFPTGDGGYFDAEGRLFWEGRLTDIIKTGGANVSPLEIDAAAAEYAGVKIARTVGVPHNTLGEMVVTCVVPHDGMTVDEAALRDFLKARLASYKVPRRVLFLQEEELSLTGSAKVKTSTLRELAAKRLAEEPAAR